MAARVGQEAVEVLGESSGTGVTAQVGQQAVEVIANPNSPATIIFSQVGQIVVEVLGSVDAEPVVTGGSGRWFSDMWGPDDSWLGDEL